MTVDLIREAVAAVVMAGPSRPETF